MDVFRCVSREKCGFGVAVLCKKSLLTKVNPSKRFRSFEYIDTVVKSSSKTVRLVVVYRPLPLKKNGSTSELFFEEFGSILKHLATEKRQIIVVCDFNFHIDDHKNSCAGNFMELLQTFDSAQHVEQPTHKENHILDLIITRSEDNIVGHISVMDPALSDHYAIRWKVFLPKPLLEKKDIIYRSLNRIDLSQGHEELEFNR